MFSEQLFDYFLVPRGNLGQVNVFKGEVFLEGDEVAIDRDIKQGHSAGSFSAS